MIAVLLKRSLLVLCVFAAAAAEGHAQQYPAQATPSSACPWLTQGSAEKVLGGEADIAVHLFDASQGTCTFALKADPNAVLKLDVSKVALPSCGSNGVKLKGIGNEAMRCRLPGSAAANAEMIGSRVRDLYFTLTLVPNAKRSPSKPAGVQEDVFELSAELVAGNLF